MIKMGRKEPDQPTQATQTTQTTRPTPPMTPPPAPPLSPMEEKKPLAADVPPARNQWTTIGERIEVEGTIRGQENLTIEGSMKGNIQLDKNQLTIGSKGRVEGEIQANDVNVSGLLKGSIKARGRVQITKDADFLGEIHSKSISVEDGAYFKGMIELDSEPHRKADVTAKPAEAGYARPATTPPPKVEGGN
jgi:cytoskeletal protein CcmA (bactofilin family)